MRIIKKITSLKLSFHSGQCVGEDRENSQK
jgi:hypothetical protein